MPLGQDGSVVGWGYNKYRQINVPDGYDFVAIAAGGLHSLALRTDGSIVGWGFNSVGQLNVPDGYDFVAISAGGFHNLALRTDGSIVGWGYNNVGQLNLPDGNDFVAISAGYTHGLGLRQTETPVLQVVVDIKPGSCTNPLNVKSRGVLPVAILGTEDFDVNEIDIATIRLAGVAPIRSALEDIGAPPDDYDCEDLQQDGFDDLILKFKTQEIVEVLGDVEDGDAFVLTLTGSLKSDDESEEAVPIKGEDVVLILKKGKK